MKYPRNSRTNQEELRFLGTEQRKRADPGVDEPGEPHSDQGFEEDISGQFGHECQTSLWNSDKEQVIRSGKNHRKDNGLTE